jgi:hypothetical protein
MKKLYTLSILFISAVTFGQSVVISTVVDGTLPSDGCAGVSGTSSPKITELYVSGTVNFTNYRLQTESNGAADASLISWNSGLDLTPLGTVTNSFVYLVVTPSTTFSEMYPAVTLPTGLTAGNIPNGNGNDAYRIVITDGATPTPAVLTVVDQFGNPLDIPTGSADYSAVWAYQDSYAKRVNGVGPNGGTFTNSSFTYGGVGAFVAPNNNCAFISNAIGLGSFALANQEFAIAGLKVFPNPVTNGNLFITSDSNDAKQVTIFDVLGKQVVKTTVTNQPVNVSALSSGVYMVKISEDGKTATRKLVIR